MSTEPVSYTQTDSSCMAQLKGIDWLRRSSLLSAECIEKYFVLGEFADLRCFLYILSRVFGYLLVFCSGLVKLPQIITIWANSDAKGVSMLAEFLILCSIFGNLTYGFTHNLPLPTYGDSYFLFLHTAIIILLIIRYERSNSFYMSWGLVLFCLTICLLLFSGLLPNIVAVTIIKLSTAFAVSSRSWQLYVNWANKGTGQLSTLSTLLLLITSFSRIFTSLQDADPQTAITFIFLTILNLILLYQLGYYWNKSPASTACRLTEQLDDETSFHKRKAD